jgi:ribosomal protein S18 acetylase RimI-like enzyme
MIEIKRLEDTSRDWAKEAFLKWWTVPFVVSHEKRLYFDDMPGFVAFLDGEPSGLLTYDINGREFEVATINSAVQDKGIGRALMEAAVAEAKKRNCKKVWLTTTNANINALRFYQRVGMRVAAWRIGEMEEARRLKPQIPLEQDGIPIRDEVVMELIVEI